MAALVADLTINQQSRTAALGCDFCLMHRSIMARYRRTALNGKSRPQGDIRDTASE